MVATLILYGRVVSSRQKEYNAVSHESFSLIFLESSFSNMTFHSAALKMWSG